MHALTAAVRCLLGALAVVHCTEISKLDSHAQDLDAVKHLLPLKEESSVFFWRPQKVGSSTLLSILMSYGFRYNFLPRRKSSANSYCRKFAKCAITQGKYGGNETRQSMEKYVMQRVPGAYGQYDHGKVRRKDVDLDRLADTVSYKISLGHEICNLDAHVVQANMLCTFARNTSSEVRPAQPEVLELFMVREPLSRAISVYYFWGELFKMRHEQKRRAGVGAERGRALDSWNGGTGLKLGKSKSNGNVSSVVGAKFTYHGDETTSPPLDIALAFANSKIYRRGMPGPSFTWSAFADNIEDALQIVASDRVCTIVLERLPESLVVAAHYLGWSLADMVVTMRRKSLSSHPKWTNWPAQAGAVLREQLEAPHVGEILFYNATVRKLDERVAALGKQGVRVQEEVERLQQLQERATKICLDDTHLAYYKKYLSQQRLPPHSSENKLRDVEDKYAQEGHIFSFNREILVSTDVCGACEAHAMLLSMEKGAASVLQAQTLFTIDKSLLLGNVNFVKCPSPP